MKAGLIARDILRIEAGLLLNGQDIDKYTFPNQVGLCWTLSKARIARNDFLCCWADESALQVVGLISHQNAPIPRSGNILLDLNNLEIGYVTSGCHSPFLNANICIGRIFKMNRMNDLVTISCRKSLYEYKITKIPFIPKRHLK